MKNNSILYITLLFWLGVTLPGLAQTTLKGRVVDENGRGLSNVTVVNTTSGRSTPTDDGGNFTMAVSGATTLLFSSVGYTEKRVAIRSGETTVRVVMESADQAVEEVVVTRGYVQRPKETSTGASSIITGRDIQDIPVPLESLLQGRAPGLNVQVNTGAPGFRGTTQIRGLSTLSMSGDGDASALMPTSPLFVIDGVPLDADRASEFGLDQQGPGISPLSMIPPEDIESIEILRDAQATSLYGSLAAYGVIIINTKRGNSEVPRITYIANTYFKTPPQLRETLGGNLERRLKLQQIYGNAFTQEDIDRIQGIPHLTDSLNAYYNNSTDWQSLYFRTTLNHSHNLTVDGGNQQMNYKANFGYSNDEGIIRNTGFTRYTANLRMDYSPDTKLRFTGQVYAQLGKRNRGDGIGVLQTGVAAGGLSSTLLPPPSFYLASSEYMSSISTRNSNNARVIRPYIEGSYEIIRGLRLTSALSYEFTSNTEDTFTPSAANNQFSAVSARQERATQLYSRNSLNYSKTLNEDHNIFINLFNEIRNITRQETMIRQERTPNDFFEGPLGYDGYFSRGGGILPGFRDERALSFALSTSYDYKRRYVLDLSYRMDGSSANGFGNLYTRNPAVGLRWNAHHEEWGQDLTWMNEASIRASWGINVMPNSTLERIYGRYDIFGNYNQQPGLGINFGQIPNPDLRPTTSMQYNLGVNMMLFDNKVDFVYDTYYKKVDNLLFEEQLNSSTGFSRLASNDAAIANYGHELMVNIRPLPPGGKLNWIFSINGAFNRDILLQLPQHYGGQFVNWQRRGDDIGQHVVFRVGTSALSNYLLMNQGVYSRDQDVPIDPTTGWRMRSQVGEYFEAGDPIWVDQNGDYRIDDNDFVRTGNSQPLITGGMNNVFTYKNVTLNIFVSYTAKRTILNNALAERMNLMANPFGTGSSNKVMVPLDQYDVWQQPGDVTKYPYPYAYTRSGSIQPFRFDQTLWAESGSYLKINNIVLSYTFARDMLRRYGLERLRVYGSLDNVVTFSSYSGPNPENVSSLGRDVSNGYPVPRTYNIGINLSF